MFGVVSRGHLTPFLAIGLLASGCLINPVSGVPEVTVTSPEREAELGREASKQVEAQMGIVDDAELAAYVSAVGGRMASHSPRRDVSYRFQVVDMPEPNAFALPGGYIYVSRGILALANTEPELAGVLAHEIAHVAARHAAQRETRAVGVGILALPGLLAGSLIGGSVGRAIAAPFAAAGMGALASYSREQENEADRVGQEIAAMAGEDPAGLASFLATLQRHEKLQSGESRRPGFFDTHPLTPERARKTAARVAELSWQPSSAVLSRPDFLRRVDGVLVGDNPDQGVFDGQRFLHPVLDFTLVFPPGWKTVNTPSAVGAAPEKKEAQVALEIQGPGSDPRAAGRALLEEFGKSTRYQVVEDASLDIAGRRAHRVRLLAPARGGDVGIDFIWIAHGGSIYRLAGITKAESFDGSRGIFGEVGRSFRPLSAPERAGMSQDRLRIAEARGGESIASLGSRAASAWSGEEIAVANGLSDGQTLQAGDLVKISVPERYR